MAWEWIPGPTDDGEMYRPFDCFDHCVVKNEWHDGNRASRGCTHPDLPPVEWDGPDVLAIKLGVFLGRAQAIDQKDAPRKRWQSPDWWKEPPDPIEDGCPAGWMISPFARSLRPYLRRREDNGGRVPNPRFDALDDRVAQDAVLAFEEHQEHLVAYRSAQVTKRIKKAHGQ